MRVIYLCLTHGHANMVKYDVFNQVSDDGSLKSHLEILGILLVLIWKYVTDYTSSLQWSK